MLAQVHHPKELVLRKYKKRTFPRSLMLEPFVGKCRNKYIVPFYYLEKDKEGVVKEYATVKYFTDSIKHPFNANIAVKPLLSIINKLIWLRISGIVMNRNIKG